MDINLKKLVNKMAKCIECGGETFQSARTGIYTKSYICLGYQKEKYEEKTIQHVVEVQVLKRKED